MQVHLNPARAKLLSAGVPLEHYRWSSYPDYLCRPEARPRWLRVAWVEEIMVAEQVRRSGIGRQLMESFEAWARGRRARLVGLATRRAAPFYRSIGYAESATYFRRLL